MIDERAYERIVACVQAQVAGDMTPQQKDELERLVLGDAEVRRVYMAYVLETAELLRWAAHAPRDLDLDLRPPEIDMDMVLAMLRAHQASKPSVSGKNAQRLAPQAPISFDSLHQHALPRRQGMPLSARFAWMGVALAALVAVTVILWPADADRTPQAPATAAIPAEPVLVAYVVEQVDTAWSITGRARGTGRTVYSGDVLRLDRGLAKLRFTNGAELILEAPGQIEPVDRNTVKLTQGRLVAYCPTTAHGFTVKARGLDIVDLGTEFGVELAPDGQIDAHVFDGEIEVHVPTENADQTSTHSLNRGQAARLAADDAALAIVRDPAGGAFVREHEFRANVLANAGSAYHRWLASSYRLRRDTDLLLYYIFDQDTRQTERLVNHASTGEPLDGWSGVSSRFPEWVGGRFGSKQGLRFNNTDPLDPDLLQAARVPHSPGLELLDQYTILAWIKTPPPTQSGGGPIISYQVAGADDATFRFGVYYPKGDQRRPVIECGTGGAPRLTPNSQTFQSFSTIGLGGEAWHQLAVAYRDQTMRFYLDGDLIREVTDILPPQPIKPEATISIGSTPTPTAPDTVATAEDTAGFLGTIDEIAVFRRGLSSREIATLYREGLPDPPSH